MENLAPLAESARVECIEGGAPIVPGLRARLTGGHTRGHLALVFESGGQTALAIGDLCPTTCHLHPLWNMAYDTHPLETRRVKPQLLAEACEGGWWVLWPHDAKVAAARLARQGKRGFHAGSVRAAVAAHQAKAEVFASPSMLYRPTKTGCPACRCVDSLAVEVSLAFHRNTLTCGAAKCCIGSPRSLRGERRAALAGCPSQSVELYCKDCLPRIRPPVACRHEIA